MESSLTKERKIFAGLALILFTIITVSIFYLFSMSKNTVDLAFSYVAGISMIVLPCTLPLAFVIVPLSMGKGYRKGFGMALLFGLGLAITIALYGVFVSVLGSVIGLDDAIGQAGTVSKILFMIGGAAAFLFGLSELGLLKLKLPSYARTPQFIDKRKDYAKAFFLGLFLGNAGVGCPNPLFYIILGDIAVKGSVLFGAWIGFIHGIGRATPLVFLSILGIIGVNATSYVMKHMTKVKKVVGWSLVLLGAVIFIMGGAHGWYEETVVHRGWNAMVKATGLPAEFEAEGHGHEGPGDFIPPWIAPWLLIALVVVPIIWYYRKKKGEKNGKRSGMRDGS
ncbi:MAG: cytochrome c biogenesis CcdA family protein [Candidatus Nanoarchaeia archaeon]